MSLTPKLLVEVVLRFGLSFVVLGVLIFVPAGTLRYWQAWMYLVTLFVPMTAGLSYLVRSDPGLLERRMRKHEKEPAQRRLVRLLWLVSFATYVVPGLDQRFGWSRVPAAASIAADALVLAGYSLILRVFRENTFASRVVEVERGQRVIKTGPYAIVRHPMYLGAVLIFLPTPLALGSYWASIPALLLVPLLVQRIRNEEEVLSRDLPGYREYVGQVRSRLLPRVW